MKNTLFDLNNHLYAQMERLSDEDLTPDQLRMELCRAKGIEGISENIINNARLALDAQIKLSDLPKSILTEKNPALKMLGHVDNG